MAVSDPPIRTYSDTTAHRTAISDYISLIDPTDTPVVSYFGLEGDAGKFRIREWPNTRPVWLEDTLAALSDAIGASISSTATALTVTDATLFHVGHVVEADSERMWVSAVATSTNVLTVTRGFGGTQASHASSATVYVVNMARLEGADTNDDYKTDVTSAYNYTQIIHGGVKVSRSMQRQLQWGIADEMAYQVNKKIPELTRLLEKGFFRGDRKSGSATAPRSFGGLETFITNNTASAASAALTRRMIEDRMQAIFEDGGKPDLLICGPWLKRKITGFYEDTVRTERNENRGGTIIDYVLTEFGEVQILMSRWCPTSKLYVISTEHIGFLPFDPFFTQDLAISGDYERKEVIGEYTLVVRQDKAHGYIKSISTAS